MKVKGSKTPKQTRRYFIKTTTLAAGAGVTAISGLNALASGEMAPALPPAPKDVSLKLLDGKLAMDTGVSFGVPWPQGSVKKSDSFILDSQGKRLPVQSWPLAYWPDGSIKFSVSLFPATSVTMTAPPVVVTV